MRNLLKSPFIKDPQEKQQRKQQPRCTSEGYINRSNKHDKIRSRINRNRVVCYRTPSYSRRRRSLYTHVRRLFRECVSANRPYMRERISASVYARRVLRRPLPVANVCQAERDVDRKEVNAPRKGREPVRALRAAQLVTRIPLITGDGPKRIF